MNVYWDMFRAFFCIGGLTFGGGYAMLPMLEREIVDKRHWTTAEELLDFYAVGQCTPGIIAVNVATLIGFRQKRYLGAFVCTTGVVAPSLIIITLIAGALKAIAGNEIVAHAFGGIRIAVCVLVVAAVVKLFKPSVKDKLTAAIFAATFIAMALIDISPIAIVIIAGLLGLCAKRLFAKGVDKV
ncbi:MAG: chromate transporter [Candidatus Fimivivens sp.]